MSNKFFGEKLIGWYTNNKRELPWRNTKDPYYIWLSEIILQQTRVLQGLPYYERFIEAFPTVQDLANAPLQIVLRLWQGLGYYSRARNLHHTAQLVVSEYNGSFPNTYHDLLQLKGIGSYTAAAIASFAFDEPVAVVDGNVYRVLARVFGIELDINSHEGKKYFAKLAQQLLFTDDPAIYNQAIMEFGALQCMPQNPNCMFCPLQSKCVAYNTGKVNLLPIKSNKIKVRKRFFNYLVFEQAGKVAMHSRHANDIWQDLFEFHLIETDTLLQTLDEIELPVVLQSIDKELIVTPPAKIYTHVLTHQRIEAQFWHIKVFSNVLVENDLDLTFYTHDQIDQLPKPVLITSYWKEQFC